MSWTAGKGGEGASLKLWGHTHRSSSGQIWRRARGTRGGGKWSGSALQESRSGNGSGDGGFFSLPSLKSLNMRSEGFTKEAATMRHLCFPGALLC